MKSIEMLKDSFKESHLNELYTTEYSCVDSQEIDSPFNEEYQKTFFDTINNIDPANGDHLILLEDYEKSYGEFKQQALFVANLKKAYSKAIVTLQDQIQISEKVLNLNMARLRLEVNREWCKGGKLADLRLTTEQLRNDYIALKAEELNYNKEMKSIMDMRRSVNLLIHGNGDSDYIDKPYRQSHNLELEKRKLEVFRFKADVIKRKLKQIECDYYSLSKKTINTTNED